jgi:hypothetical protein
MTEADPVLCPSFPKKSIGQAHMAPVGCGVRGFLFRPLWSKNSTPKHRANGSQECVPLLCTLPSEGYLKHNPESPSEQEDQEGEGKLAECVFNTVLLQIINILQFVQPQFGPQGAEIHIHPHQLRYLIWLLSAIGQGMSSSFYQWKTRKQGGTGLHTAKSITKKRNR